MKFLDKSLLTGTNQVVYILDTVDMDVSGNTIVVGELNDTDGGYDGRVRAFVMTLLHNFGINTVML